MYKHTKSILVLVSLLLAAVLLSGSPAAAQQTDFKALMQKTLDAWSTMDTGKVAPFYTQAPTHLFFDLAPLKYNSWKEYADGVKKLLADFASLKLTLNPDAQAQQRGSTAWGAATVHTEFVTKDGAKETMDARWTVVWEKHGKDWIIAHDHFSVPTPPAPAAGEPLYKRLGGYDAIAAVVDDFIGRLISDKQLSRFFAGASSDSKRRIRQLVVDQLCSATGGPCVYIGRSMKAAHEGLGITEADWQATAGHLVATLNKFHVPQKEKDEVLSAVTSLKGEIVSAAPGK